MAARKDLVKEETTGITVKKADDMPEWYSQVVLKAKLAEHSRIKGCMVIRPKGYAIWQTVMDYFNERLKMIGVENAYFPMFIPESFFEKEKEHAEGFEPEVAWIEKKEDDGGERLALRPTSETIMYDSYSRWVRSHRDLPLRINQWCNIVRWEVSDVKLFLRSREFLWQEGHCVYATEEECDEEVRIIIDEYARLCEELLAVPVIVGRKSEKEKFAGAKYTLTIEAFMPDGKALQCGTSHNLGQGFGKAFGISFVGEDEKRHTPWQSSWGFSTRLIGAMVMTHSDDKGLVLPPKVAKNKVAIVPIIFDTGKKQILAEAGKVADELAPFDPILDDSEEHSAGWKFNQYEVEGVPLRIEIGPKDIEKRQVVMVRRDTGEKSFVPRKEILATVRKTLDTMQTDLLARAKERLERSMTAAETWDAFTTAIDERKLVFSPHCGEEECEDWIKDKTGGASTRAIPLKGSEAKGKACVHCGKPAAYRVYFSKSY
ncbi:proline--tRNA ligase [Candidatus Woesearchaeota archaeon]|nr:proline--tRNA ligase [Candidatus Woesearchaeota archaeon]